jgi:hypothetical protein
MFGVTLLTVAGWFTWDGGAGPADGGERAVRLLPGKPVATPAMSAAEYRFRHSQTRHWRALMLQR